MKKKNILSSLPKFNTIISILVIVISLFIFFSVGSLPTFQLTDIPSYQIVSDEILSLFLIFISTVAEDAFAWVAVPLVLFTIFSIILQKFEIKQVVIISLILIAIINPLIWTAYHNAHYGSDAVATQATFAFGVVMTLYILVTKNIMLPLFFHPASNLGIAVFQMYKISGLMGYFWALMILMIIIITLLWWKNKTKGRLLS